MTDWKETAKLIAEEAIETCNHEDDAMDFIQIEAEWSEEAVCTGKAYQVVCDARNNDESEIFDIAKMTLEAIMENNAKYKEELTTDIDKLITSLAAWIIYTQAIDYYWQLMKKREMIYDD